MAKITAVVTEGDRQNGYKRVRVLFGTNYFLEIVESDGRVEFLPLCDPWEFAFGGVEAIRLHDNGKVFMAAADPRRDGYATGY